MSQQQPPGGMTSSNGDAPTPKTPGAGGFPQHNAAPSSQTPGHPSFRRQRASRACETCHARKVRCDAASLGVPCTNCVAFSIECKIPAPKRKKAQLKKDSESQAEERNDDSSTPNTIAPQSPVPLQREVDRGMASAFVNDATTMGLTRTDDLPERPDQSGYGQVMKPKFVRAPIKEAGRVAYLGESSNLSLLVHDRFGTQDVVHYPLPEHIRGARARMDELDTVEIEILHQRGAFLLPPRSLCDELVDAFFKWVAPVVPVVNRTRFMRRYRDSKNPPSLLLLQAILLAGSRVCSNPQLMDSNGSTTPAATTFYKRAKALYDANYEDDRVTIVQALILMGWYWEGPEDVTKNVFYWTRLAIIVAQGSGMHRSVESSQLSRTDKRLLKRIWWTLFTRDRSVAVALGRPCCINLEDSDVEMLTEEDFVDDEPDRPSEFLPEQVHVQFFLNYVKLTEIMGLVLAQQYSAAGKLRKNNALDLTQADMTLADWLHNCPKEVYWERSRHHFWSALLHSNYYTTLCLLHRAHMPPAGTPNTTVQDGMVVENPYPSRNVAYQAAGMITSIIESLRAHDQLRYAPAFIVYSLFSALIMHVYQMRSSNAAVVAATEQRLHTCMNALKEVSKVWLVAKMVHTLFESILGNKTLQERVQKAGGTRHKHRKTSGNQRPRHSNSASNANASANANTINNGNNNAQQASKRKFDEVEPGFTNGTQPAPQVSYERSRPQTPAMTPSQELPAHTQPSAASMPQMSTGASTLSPSMPRTDAFMGSSRNTTRPTSPFNAPAAPPHANPSYPGTPLPSDLYLVTKNSPPISQDLWNNFQPDQLFPADTNISLPPQSISPGQSASFIDPALQIGAAGSAGMHTPQGAHGYSHAHGHGHGPGPGPFAHAPQATHTANWAHVATPGPAGNDETWSNSSVSQGAGLPMTVNVEDWFQFFGMQGDLSQIPAFGTG